MKFKVLAYTFSVPLFWFAIFLLQYFAPDLWISRIISSGFLLGLLLGSFIVRFFFSRKYLNSLVIDDKNIHFTYFTPLAFQHHEVLQIDTITYIKVKRKIFFLRDFTSVNFFSKTDVTKYFLLNTAVKQKIEEILQTYPEKLVINVE